VPTRITAGRVSTRLTEVGYAPVSSATGSPSSRPTARTWCTRGRLRRAASAASSSSSAGPGPTSTNSTENGSRVAARSAVRLETTGRFLITRRRLTK